MIAHDVQVEASDPASGPWVVKQVDFKIQLSAPGFGGHAVALALDDTLWGWGDNTGGILSLSPAGSSYDKPVRISPDADWESAATGFRHTLAIKKNGTLWLTGIADIPWITGPVRYGYPQFTQVGTDADWRKAFLFYQDLGDTCFALKKDGTLWAWGASWFLNNLRGVRGFGIEVVERPQLLEIGTGWKHVTGWGMNGVISGPALLHENGSLWGWRDADAGLAFEKIIEPADWAQVDMGGELGVGRRSDGTLWHLEPATSGQWPTRARRIGSDSDWTQVAAHGDAAFMGIKSDGSLWIWSPTGETGDTAPFGTLHTEPTQADIGAGWRTIVPSLGLSAMALKSDGSLWEWGLFPITYRERWGSIVEGLIHLVQVEVAPSNSTNPCKDTLGLLMLKTGMWQQIADYPPLTHEDAVAWTSLLEISSSTDCSPHSGILIGTQDALEALPAQPGRLAGSIRFPTSEAMERVFPRGGSHQWALRGGRLADVTGVLTNTSEPPGTIPQFSNSDDMSAMDPAEPFVCTWRPWHDPPPAASVVLVISHSNNPVVSTELPADKTAFTIPPGTLERGNTYNLALTFRNRTANTAISGHGWDFTTSRWFRLGSGRAEAPAIVQGPQAQSAFAGTTVHFRIVAVGDPPLSYQWIMPDGSRPSWARNAVLTLNLVSDADQGAYVAIVSNATGSTPSAPAALTVLPRYDVPRERVYSQTSCVPPAGGVLVPGWIYRDGNYGTWRCPRGERPPDCTHTARYVHLINGQVDKDWEKCVCHEPKNVLECVDYTSDLAIVSAEVMSDGDIKVVHEVSHWRLGTDEDGWLDAFWVLENGQREDCKHDGVRIGKDMGRRSTIINTKSWNPPPRARELLVTLDEPDWVKETNPRNNRYPVPVESDYALTDATVEDGALLVRYTVRHNMPRRVGHPALALWWVRRNADRIRAMPEPIRLSNRESAVPHKVTVVANVLSTPPDDMTGMYVDIETDITETEYTNNRKLLPMSNVWSLSGRWTAQGDLELAYTTPTLFSTVPTLTLTWLTQYDVWTLSLDDFRLLPSLANVLTHPTRVFDSWLAAQLSLDTEAVLWAYHGDGSDQLPVQQALVRDLNRILRGGASIYDAERFAGVGLRDETHDLKANNPKGRELERLNRLLLEDAYPLELWKMQPRPTFSKKGLTRVGNVARTITLDKPSPFIVEAAALTQPYYLAHSTTDLHVSALGDGDHEVASTRVPVGMVSMELLQPPKRAPYQETAKDRVRLWCLMHKGSIRRNARTYAVSPRAIVGAIAWEAIENPWWAVRSGDAPYASTQLQQLYMALGPGPGHVHPILGCGALDSAAGEVEQLKYVPFPYVAFATDLGVRRHVRLHDASIAVTYIAAIMHAWAVQAETGGYPAEQTRSSPPILCTWYNGIGCDGPPEALPHCCHPGEPKTLQWAIETDYYAKRRAQCGPQDTLRVNRRRGSMPAWVHSNGQYLRRVVREMGGPLIQRQAPPSAATPPPWVAQRDPYPIGCDVGPEQSAAALIDGAHGYEASASSSWPGKRGLASPDANQDAEDEGIDPNENEEDEAQEELWIDRETSQVCWSGDDWTWLQVSTDLVRWSDVPGTHGANCAPLGEAIIAKFFRLVTCLEDDPSVTLPDVLPHSLDELRTATVTDTPALVWPWEGNNRVSQPITFRWINAAFATEYEVAVTDRARGLIVEEAVVTACSDEEGRCTYKSAYAYVEGAQYVWRVRGRNSNGDGPWSEENSFVMRVSTVTTSPMLLEPASNSTDNDIAPVFTWMEPQGAWHSEIMVMEAEGAAETVLTAVVVGGVWQPGAKQELQYGKTYSWKVRAVGESSMGPWSEARTFTTVVGPPREPPTPIAPEGDGHMDAEVVEFAWSAASEATEYSLEIARAEDGPRVAWFSLAETTKTVHVDQLYGAPMFGAPMTYYWRVQAENEWGAGPWSSWRAVILERRAPSGVPVLVTPENVATGVGMDSVFEWTSVDGATAYDVELSVGSPINIVETYRNIRTTTFEVPAEGKLQEGTAYYWSVRAVNDFGAGPWSEQAAFMTR